jgi:hypothetical protein
MQHDRELAALRVICQGAEGKPLWDEGLRLLRDYRFRTPVYQVVFDALRRIRSPHEGALCERLQRELVLARFPGLSAAEYFQPHGLTYHDALGLLARLAPVSSADFADSADSGRTC